MTVTEIFLLSFFPALMAFSACSDLVSMTISNKISLLLILGFFILAALSGLPMATVGWHLLGGLFVLAIGIACFAKGWVGGGDAKLMAATALWVGWAHMFDYVAVASLVGGVLTFAILYLRQLTLPDGISRIDWIARLHDPRNGVPYGIALAAAGLIVYPRIELWRAAIGL